MDVVGGVEAVTLCFSLSRSLALSLSLSLSSFLSHSVSFVLSLSLCIACFFSVALPHRLKDSHMGVTDSHGHVKSRNVFVFFSLFFLCPKKQS